MTTWTTRSWTFGRGEVNRYTHRISAIIMSNYLLQRTFKQGS